MAVMSIRIDENKQKLLKILSSLEEKTIGVFVEDLLEDYMKRNKKSFREKLEILGLDAIKSEFMVWSDETGSPYDEP